jgi:O-antigen/teichoic acid export membrane protein
VHKELKKNSVISAMFLFLQTGYSGIIGLISNIILTAFIEPAAFGLYIIVLSIISILNYFSDIGLVGALIQKKEIDDKDIATTFTVQQILIITLITIGFFATDFIRNFYKLGNDGILLYWSVLISFFLSSLKSVPSLLLERQVQFKKIAFVQMLEQTVFNIILCIAAILGYGVYSFVYAILLRSFVGLVAMYSLNFWVPKIGIYKDRLTYLLSFGLPFQASSFLALFKDDLIILFLGNESVIGLTGVGYIGWAKKWAETPLRIIMDNLTKIMFPMLSRLQDKKADFNKVFNEFLFIQMVILVPTMTMMLIAMPHLINLIPKYGKWTEALPYFNIFVISSMITSFGAPFLTALNALKKVSIPFITMIVWTAISWILVPLLSNIYGFYGFPLTHLVISLTYIIVIFVARRHIHITFFKDIGIILMSSLFAALCVFVLNYYISSIVVLILSVLIGYAAWYASMKFIFKRDIIRELRSIITA